LTINEIKNDITTYREIFANLDAKYCNGKNKNTGRKRSKDIPNDVNSFNRQRFQGDKAYIGGDTALSGVMRYTLGGQDAHPTRVS
jgi:hypothetical protein